MSEELTPRQNWLLFACCVALAAAVLFLGCHHEADGLGCADDVPQCEVRP